MPFDSLPKRRRLEDDVREALTVEGLRAWLREQDPMTSYHYYEVRDCLLARYLTARRVDFVNVAPNLVRVTDETCVDLDPVLNYVAMNVPWTYGDALARLERWREKNAL